jgi:hypothetical protein
MGKTFHVKSHEKTHERQPYTPEQWRMKKRMNRKLQKTYVQRINFANTELALAAEVGNRARANKFQRVLERTQERLEEISS